MKRSVPSPLNPDRLPSPVVPRPSPWAQLLHPTTRSSIPHQTPPSPASHLWSPARQARPPPEREARRRSLMVRAGDRSHHGGGPIGPGPGGSGSHSLRRCSLVSEQEPRRQRQQAGTASRDSQQGVPLEAAGLPGTSGAGTGPAAQFPFPRARPALHPQPDTCDHRQLPMAETKGFLEEHWEPASFPQSKTDSTGCKQTPT